MATFYFIRTKKTSGTVSLSIRVQDPKIGLNIRQSTPISVDLEEWNKAQKSTKAREYYRKRKPELWKKLDEITGELNALVAIKGDRLTKDDVTKVVNEIYYREQLAAERKNGDISFMDYFAQFLEGMKAGTEKNDSGLQFSSGTYRRFNLGYNRLLDFQEYRKRPIDWQDITPEFIADYRHFLQHIEELWPTRGVRSRNEKASNYSLNTVDTRLKELKYLMHRYASQSRGIDPSNILKNATFKVNNNRESDSIYLTKEDVEKIKAVDLSGKTKGYTYARDLFLVGIHTAQRISDYNHITKDNIKTREVVRVNGDTETRETRLVIELVQQKTKKRVFIPVNTELKAILEKYDYQLPSLADQVLNHHLKDICEEAGLNEPIQIRSTKGGVETTSFVPKWQLCHSHTARRTGATWMYLAGMDYFDIMKITGHSTPEMLKKYIKADALEISDKLADKYDIFK